uniref:Defensin-like protein n=1 Tax=Cajanus cajan TaxID=3821 RepID=A0A151T5G1_CAJCA|nr:hypothetical protein KK1_016819 [Cajanus cajan]
MGDCDNRCKAEFSNGIGYCESNLCTCYYKCGPPPGTVDPKWCNIDLGLCNGDDKCKGGCCNLLYSSIYRQGQGTCVNIIGTPSYACSCFHVCK